MTYTATTWVNGTTPAINATNLNHIEQGVLGAHVAPVISGSGSWDTPTFVVDGTEHRVGIGVASPTVELDIDGAVLVTTGPVTFAAAVDFVFDGTTGTMIGTATTQKLGFWGVTPVVQPDPYVMIPDLEQRGFDAADTSLNEIANTLCTLIVDLQAVGIVG
jgi:hypothetical protein